VTESFQTRNRSCASWIREVLGAGGGVESDVRSKLESVEADIVLPDGQIFMNPNIRYIQGLPSLTVASFR